LLIVFQSLVEVLKFINSILEVLVSLDNFSNFIFNRIDSLVIGTPIGMLTVHIQPLALIVQKLKNFSNFFIFSKLFVAGIDFFFPSVDH